MSSLTPNLTDVLSARQYIVDTMNETLPGLLSGISGVWSDWTPTLTGWSANPTGAFYRYARFGNVVVCALAQGSSGTSNSTGVTITLPIQAANTVNGVWSAPCRFSDNSVTSTVSGMVYITAGSTTASFFTNWAAAGWTASGGKSIISAVFKYEVN